MLLKKKDEEEYSLIGFKTTSYLPVICSWENHSPISAGMNTQKLPLTVYGVDKIYLYTSSYSSLQKFQAVEKY